MRISADQRRHPAWRQVRRQDPRPRGRRGPAAFHGTRPYARLREEFEARLQARQQAGDLTDRRDAQIARLKDEATTLRQRLADRDTTIAMLNDFRDQALAGLRTQNKRAEYHHVNRRDLVPRGPGGKFPGQPSADLGI